MKERDPSQAQQGKDSIKKYIHKYCINFFHNLTQILPSKDRISEYELSNPEILAGSTPFSRRLGLDHPLSFL